MAHRIEIFEIEGRKRADFESPMPFDLSNPLAVFAATRNVFRAAGCPRTSIGVYSLMMFASLHSRFGI
jgi:hypothetical protein